MKGQGIVEYALILILIVVIIIVFVVVFGPFIVRTLGTDHSADPCWTGTIVQCQDSKVEQCLALEKYTKDQCVILVGGGK